jgi:EmrB/QacA subfamily drug resistance transporter
MALRVTDANRKWWVLVAMTGSLSMILLDQTVVSVALPSIQDDLDLSQTQVQWVINAYLLAIAALVAVGGRLADMFNPVRIFLLGVILFAAGSALTGLAQDETWVIAARAFQGVGAALMIPPSGSIVINEFSVAERGKAMGIYAGVSMIFLSLGPLIGGVFTEWTWRAVFWINVPVAALTVLLTLAAKPDGEVKPGQRLDLKGIATLVPGLVALVLALQQSTTWGWGDPLTWGLLVAAGILLTGFLLIEPRVREPLVELRLFRGRNFAGNNAVLFFVQFALIGLTVFGAIFVQDILGFSAIEAGLSLLAVTLPLLVVAPQAGKLYDRIGPRLLVGAGSALAAAGLLWDAAVLDKLSYPWLVPGYVALGIGIGLVMGPANTDGMNAAARELRAQASGVIQTVRQIGGTVGLAIMGTIVTSVEHSRIQSHLAAVGVPEDTVHRLEGILAQGAADQSAAAATLPAGERARIVDVVRDSVTSGITWAYYVGGAVLVIAAVVGFVVLRHVQYEDDPEGAVAAPMA